MKQKIAMQWADALESGEYRQDKRSLNTKVGDDERFCCLGVLCMLAMKAGENVVRTWRNPREQNGTSYFNGESMLFPHDLLEWAGFRLTDPIMPFHGGRFSTSYLNDGSVYFNSLSFSQIAWIIRENWAEIE